MKTSVLVASLCVLFAAFAAVGAVGAEVGVQIEFGLQDKAVTDWSGSVSVEPGRVALLSGWHFQKQDTLVDGTSWKASTHPVQLRNRSNNPQKAKQARSRVPVRVTSNGVLVTLADVTDDSVVNIATAQGDFSFRIGELPFGETVTKMKGGVRLQRTAATLPLSGQKTDDDFPAIASGEDGTVYAAYVSFAPGLDRGSRRTPLEKAPEDFSYLAKPAGGDRVWLHVRRDGAASGERIAVTPGGGDIYKCAVAVDNRDRVFVVWSERPRDAGPGSDGEFDIYGRLFEDGAFSEIEKVSSKGGNDTSPVAVADGNGRIWVAWQGAERNQFRVMLRKRATDGTWSVTTPLSPKGGNCWSPAIASDGSGNVAVAWDTYNAGDYDIWFREMTANDAGAPQPVANTGDYEARPTMTYGRTGDLWIAWEESGPSWGKDWGAYDKETAIPLYSSRTIGMRVRSGGEWKQSAASWRTAMPGSRVVENRAPVKSSAPEGTAERVPGSHATIAGQATFNNIARLATDGEGRVWLIARSKMGNFRSPLGTVWMNYAAWLDGDRWVGPVLLPHSDNLIYNLPAATAAPGGGLIVAHSSDHRQAKTPIWAEAEAGQNQGEENVVGPAGELFVNDVYLSVLDPDGEPGAVVLKAAASMPAKDKVPSAETRKERADVERFRDYRATIGGEELQILRGEFHRHTEISGDGGNDGPLEDMWRYAMDVAMFDWIGNGDHDNGRHREYPWWLTQKTTDAYHLPGHFDPLFTYERSVKYPEGHRNVVFVQRGVRTLPRLPISSELRVAPAPDTQMLYKYLRHFGGICASHTSATNMGTDWRDNDTVVEPMVEIYQGARQNYERPGAPRSPTEDDAIGGWRPKGFINLALKKGYRFAFQASSDHRSTHISYCNVYAADASRQAIFDGMKARRVYGATDNIIADYRCTVDGREHMMGEEFVSKGPPELRLKLRGTAPFAKVTLVKDDEEVEVWEPEDAEVEIAWTDPAPRAGETSYYYFRGEQQDEELVWVSPMWIKYEP